MRGFTVILDISCMETALSQNNIHADIDMEPELDANELSRRQQVTQHYKAAIKDLSAQARAENERIKVKSTSGRKRRA